MSVYRVEQPTTLVAFLGTAMPEMKKSTVKDRLRDGAILVNGQPQTKATLALIPGDTVELKRGGGKPTPPHGVEILHVDRDLVVVNKPSGLLTVGTTSGGDVTVLNVVGPQLRGGERLFPCHRLDRGTSGVLLLPRSPEAQQFFFANWGETRKTYVAVVEGRMEHDEGTVDAALFENPQTLTVRVSTQPNARPAVTHYRVLQRSTHLTLVELRIDTGRKHQIRVHMLSLGHPIVGDDRYGSMKRRSRLCLHARELVFPHPTTGEVMTFQAPVPSLFTDLVK